jgi:hypothetical protein
MSFYNFIYFVQLNFYVNLDNRVFYFDWSKKLIADLVVCKNIQIKRQKIFNGKFQKA